MEKRSYRPGTKEVVDMGDVNQAVVKIDNKGRVTLVAGLTERAVREILELKQNPLKGHPLKGSLRGVRALEFSLFPR